MSLPPTGFADTTDPPDEEMPQSSTATPSVEESSTEVLITTQEVLFGTAAAAGMRRVKIGGRLLDLVRRIFVTSRGSSRPKPPYYPKRYTFLEDSVMGREMDRL
jgi:hypothetical protein